MNLKSILLLLLLYTSVLKAQIKLQDSTCTINYCSCGDYQVPAGVMISHVHNKGEWMISYRYMSMNMSGISDGAHEASRTDVLTNYAAAPDLMKMNMHMLMAMYGLTDRLTLMTMLNYSSNYMEMTMPSGKSFHRHSMSTAGFGDTKLYALFALVKKTQTQLLLSAGVSLPSGSINLKGQKNSAMYSDQRYPYMMQLGSGSVDILPALSYLHQQNKITLGAQLSGVVRTNYTANGYRLGNEASINCWSSWQWLEILSSSLRAEVLYSGKIKGEDHTLNKYEELSANPVNYGGMRTTLFIGSSLQGKKGFLKKNRLSLEYGLPVYQNLNGIQMPFKNSLLVAWALSF